MWKDYRYRLERWGCLLLERLIPRLSLRACTACAQVVGALAFWLDRRSRHIALENLRAAFGETVSEGERKQIALWSFQNFARAMFGLFWSPRIDSSNMTRLVKTSGFDGVAQEARESGRGVVFSCAHFGSWEIAAMSAQIHGLPLQILAENFKNPSLDEIFIRLRGRNFHTPIKQDNSFLKLIRGALRGNHCALLADLTVPPSQAAVRIRAFERNGQALEICCTRLPAVLAVRAKALVIQALAYPCSDAICDVRALPPLDPAAYESEEAICQAIWNNLEKAILQFPHLWLWSYKHFRYKPRDARREYPDYAAFHPLFESTARA
jgi:KDO2-lipid IV(A) lauroyltransferase